MNTELYKEAMRVVDKLNSKISNELWDKGFVFEWAGDPNGTYITFQPNHISLWSNYYDGREFDEDKNEYEDLYGYVVKEFNKLVEQYNSIKL